VDGATVSVAVVASRTEAELIVGLLRSHGVSAAVSADDAGGQYPQLQAEGVRVLVAPLMKPRPVGCWAPWIGGDLASGADGAVQRPGHGRRDDRQPDGRRTFRFIRGQPLSISYGEDSYRRVFGAAPDPVSATVAHGRP
jgi:hypothetical protein